MSSKLIQLNPESDPELSLKKDKNNIFILTKHLRNKPKRQNSLIFKKNHDKMVIVFILCSDQVFSEELGANIFRITQTEAKIRREAIKGQRNLENASRSVGAQVRTAIANMGGTMPENLEPCEDIKAIKSDLKKTNRAFAKNDKKITQK